MYRYYIVPEIGGGDPINENTPDSYRPKYIAAMVGVAWIAMKFGHEPFRLVYCDLSTFDHNTLVLNADVVSLPADLDQIVPPGSVNNIQSKLEACSIPSGWVTSSMTYRQVLRKTCQIAQFYQRLRGLGLARLLSGSISLNTQFQSLPAGARQKLRDAADSFQFDRTGMTNTTTIRTILKAMADQWSGPIYCGVEI